LAQDKRERERGRKRPGAQTGPARRKSCQFCKAKVDDVDYKDINVLRREVAARDEELARRAQEIEGHKAEYEKLEKTFNVETLEFEVKQKEAGDRLAERDQEIATHGHNARVAESQVQPHLRQHHADFQRFDVAV
jgi:ribosomal protein S18